MRLQVSAQRTCVATLCVALIIAMAQLAQAPGAAAVAVCDAGETTYLGMTRSHECVADTPARVRGFALGACISDARSRVQGAVYFRGTSCPVAAAESGNVYGEAIAQARALATLNAQRSGLATAVVPQLQWEITPDGVLLPLSGGAMRADISIHETSQSSLGLIEVKGSWNQPASEALTQVNGYVAAWNANSPVPGAARAVVPASLIGDTFFVDRGINCKLYPGEVKKYQYVTHSPTNGVLMVDRSVAERCPEDGDEPDEAENEGRDHVFA